MTLSELQAEHAKWLNREFSDQEWMDGFLGVVEEVGELAHAILKGKQKIRGDAETHELKKRDAIGDIVIFLCSYCTTNGLDLQDCVMAAWNEVKERRWNRVTK
jgi:NTP pyrophosphatase (non-canonical NTP hydrolase)